MKIAFYKERNKFTPLHDQDLQNLRKLPDNNIYTCEIKKARNLLHHRKFFAILKVVVENSEKWNNTEALLTALKIHLGYTNIVTMFDGSEVLQAGSIRFEVMDQDQFNKFYEASVKLLADELGVSVQELEDNHGEYL